MLNLGMYSGGGAFNARRFPRKHDVCDVAIGGRACGFSAHARLRPQGSAADNLRTSAIQAGA